MTTLTRRLVAEAAGTALLLATIVGSGISAERLSDGNAALALLANAIATGCGLVALIVTFGPVSGAHFNPVVTLALAATRRFGWKEVPGYVGAQMVGAVLGVAAAHLMFAMPVLQMADHARPGVALGWSEVVATFGLLVVILAGVRRQSASLPYAVAAYIVAAYWFTASTSFANPAVTIARSLSDTFAGIRPSDVPAFLLAQLIGAALAVTFDAWLHREPLKSPSVPAPVARTP